MTLFQTAKRGSDDLQEENAGNRFQFWCEGLQENLIRLMWWLVAKIRKSASCVCFRMRTSPSFPSPQMKTKHPIWIWCFFRSENRIAIPQKINRKNENTRQYMSRADWYFFTVHKKENCARSAFQLDFLHFEFRDHENGGRKNQSLIRDKNLFFPLVIFSPLRFENLKQEREKKWHNYGCSKDPVQFTHIFLRRPIMAGLRRWKHLLSCGSIFSDLQKR